MRQLFKCCFYDSHEYFYSGLPSTWLQNCDYARWSSAAKGHYCFSVSNTACSYSLLTHPYDPSCPYLWFLFLPITPLVRSLFLSWSTYHFVALIYTACIAILPLIILQFPLLMNTLLPIITCNLLDTAIHYCIQRDIETISGRVI